MKYHFSIILCFVFCSAYAQKAIVNNIDSLYYLIDTANTSVNNRMWDINSDAIFKRYILLCPCLKNGGRPEFFFSVEGKDDGIYINQNELTAIKLADTSTLIRKAKEIEKNSYKHDYSFFSYYSGR